MITSRPLGAMMQHDCDLCGWLDVTPAGASVDHACDFSALNGCVHLLGPEVDAAGRQIVERVPCRNCGADGDGQRDATVFRCGLFGEPCLPLFGRDRRERRDYAERADAVRLCDGCPRQLS